jgi:broad specificity phosphatase PhoE
MNVAGLLSGRKETSLTEKGIGQAKASGRKLKETMPRIDLIVCSPYERTYETAKLIAKEIGYPIADIQKNDLLVERSFGILEGTPGKNFLKDHDYREFDNVGGSETIEQLQKRAEEAFKVLQALEEDTVLVVGHGSFGRAMKRVVRGAPHTQEYEMNTSIENAAIVELI